MSYTQRPSARAARGGWAVLVVAAACAREPLSAARAPEPVPPRPPSAGEAAAGARALAGAAAALGPQDVLLDVRADGAVLAARLEAAPPDADPPRALVARWVAGGRALPWPFAGAAVLDARFVPGRGGVVVLTMAGELAWLESPGASPLILDRDVTGPLAVARGGRFLAYVRGDPPELEVFRYDLDARRAEPITSAMAPAWSPALSSDGREVVFVSGASGSPALYRASVPARGAAALRKVGEAGGPAWPAPLPHGPAAPLWLDDALVFEHEGAVWAISLAGRARKRLPGLRAPVGIVGAEALIARAESGGPTLVWPAAIAEAP